MNQRIRELIKTKSTILFPGTDTVDCKITDIEKFAELIVRECASKVDNILRERKDGGGTMGDEIREHFGVEEWEIGEYDGLEW